MCYTLPMSKVTNITLPASRPTIRDSFPGLDRRTALEAFITKGPTAAAAAQLGVSVQLYRAWVESPEGRRAIEQARTSLNSLLDIGLTNIIDKSLSRISSALEYGNSHVGKDGELRIVPMTGKDAATVLAIAFDRRQLLRKQPTNITDVDDKLEELATRLRSLGGIREPETIEATYTETQNVDNT